MCSSNQPSGVSLSFRKLNRVRIIACKLCKHHWYINISSGYEGTHLNSSIGGSGSGRIGIGISTSHLRGSIVAVVLRVLARVLQI